MNNKVRIRVSSRVFLQEVQSEAVLLDTESGTYFGLNEVGTLVWKTLDKTGSLDRAMESVMQLYPVDHKSLRRDLEAFLQDLVDRGLVEVVET